MAKGIEVRSQAEFDACVEAGNIAIVVGCRVVARGNSSVEAWENSSVEAWGNSSVVAWGNVFIRLFSALRIKASLHVSIMVHGAAKSIEGGQQTKALNPHTGAEWCEYYGIEPGQPDITIPNIDATILASIEVAEAKGCGLDMSSWHGKDDCDETNWCGTTHCRAGFAICHAGKAGFALEKKFGPEIAGRMIYAASRPNEPLPDFHASDDDAMADLCECAARQLGESRP